MGGRCRESKIVALTANAGSDVQALYVREGFDGYLTKPISGDGLERELYRLLPKELVHATGESDEIAMESIQWMNMAQTKKPVIVTTESVADLPEELVKKYEIGLISHKVRTDRGMFRDGKEIDAKGMLLYVQKEGAYIETSAASIEEYEEFFADMLERAEKVIHITISGQVKQSGCFAAMEAAKSFDNVYVVDSSQLSSGQGLLAVEAAKMAKKGLDPETILEKLNLLTSKIRTTFVTGSLSYLVKAGQMKPIYGRFLNSLMAHPVIALRKGKMKLSGIYFGTREYAQDAYIRKEVRRMKTADKGILFITYAGMEQDEISRIGRLVSGSVRFDHIYLVQASPAISANCGPNTFGLMYEEK